ncbi:hypothetical protein GCM10007301_16730 [Azorhizobium oxalatiphilum]|uniref:DNA-directed DNA polymerase n=1 Tax=Azorhizobium oxalatiphilum TaxID=980631 RepID=A0A917F7D1_9HYPH|nr:exonuclease domain-containing protein [Azorhizobium oxalatiphilum]GGF57683.1 hypothetical protein GCM10007301_16730 [Azorhizobium oxalatiphilum]
MPNRRIIVLDTETTGIQPYDKMVALAAIRFDHGTYAGHIYRIYDPRKDSDPGAFQVHGLDDWLLRFQPLFADEADEVKAWLQWADCLVMHNAAFDLRYVERELRKAERTPLDKPSFCTMTEARSRWPGSSAKLSACLTRFKLGTQDAQHDAFQDAYLTAQLYFRMHKVTIPDWPETWPRPTNLKSAPPAPPRPYPRRTVKKPARPGTGSSIPIAPSFVPRSLGELVAAARDAHMLIRFVGVRAQVPEDVQRQALDAHAHSLLAAFGLTRDEVLLDALRNAAMTLKGSQNGATTASKRLAEDGRELAVILPLLMDMVKSDGALSAAENQTIRHIFSTIRAASPEVAEP